MKKYFFPFNLWHPLYIYAILLVTTITMSRLLFNGMIFDFDYSLYQPDGSLYTFVTLRWLGLSELEAANRVISWYQIHGEPGSTLTSSFFDAELNPGPWSLVSTRFLYQTLSLPFVYLLGIPGMLAIPIISLLTLFIITSYISLKESNFLMGYVLITLLAFSPTLTRWYVANLTDGLLATLFALSIILLRQKNPKYWYLTSFILIALTSFTRFSTPYWYAISSVFFIVKNRFRGLYLFALSSAFLIPTMLAKPDPGSIVAGTSGDLLDKLLYFPISALKILFIEIAQLAAMDRSLLLILCLALIAAIINRKAIPSKYFFAILIAGWFIGSLNGVLGVNFRYQLPVIPFALWVILETFKISRDGKFRYRLDVVTQKTQQKLNTD